MPTKADIEEGEPIDIRVQVIDDLDRPSEKMARRLKVRDTAGNEFPFTVWNNNALTEYSWEDGQWYELENARGNVYNDRRSLNGSYDLEATPIDDSRAPTRSTVTPTENLVDGRPYLTLFPLERDFEAVPVYEYQIEATAVFDEDPMEATYSLAAYLRKDNAAAVTHARQMAVVSTSPLDSSLPDPFVLSDAREIELDVSTSSDREKLERLLQIQLKNAVDATRYRTDRINRIVSIQPTIEDPHGLFEACPAYGLRVEILPTGRVFVGVEIRHHARSRVTLDEYIERTSAHPDDLIGTYVEHDPDRYDVSGSGTFEGYTDMRFTDSLDFLGGQSLADWYEQKRRVPQDLLKQLRDEDPRLVNIRYSPSDDETRIHVPQLLRVAPRKEVVKSISRPFHRRWDRAAKLLPNDRFSQSIEFIADLDRLPEFDTAVDPTPIGPSRSFLSDKVDRSDNLLFGNGQTADVPSTGLKQSGIYKRPESFHVHFLVPERDTDAFDEFREKFERQLRSIGCELNGAAYHEYQLGNALEYTEVSATVSGAEPDAVLAVVPSPNDDMIVDGEIDDPYDEFKKAFGKQSISSQMVRSENLDNRWVHRNTALGLVAGAGGVPWRVDEMPGDVDCFIGLDATYDQEKGQFLGASANVVLADGTVFVSKSHSLQDGETFDEDAIVDIVKDVHREFVRRDGVFPDHIVIHRDGRLFEDVDAILDPFADAGIDIDILDIRKSGAPREAVYENGEFRIDDKGRLFFEQGGDYGFLTTTGRPEFDEKAGLGTPRTLRVVRRAGDTDMLTLLKQVYWLSEGHVGSAQRSTRLPITTYYADRCAEHARRGFLVTGELIHGLPYL